MGTTTKIGRVEIEISDASGSDAGQTIVLNGQIDENATLADLIDDLQERVTFDLGLVSFINSMGVREWIRLLRSLKAKGVAVRLVRCSEAMIHQINMIVDALGHAQVASLFAPYSCNSCGFETSLVVDVDAHKQELQEFDPPDLPCPQCEEPMQFNEIAERYFAFFS